MFASENVHSAITPSFAEFALRLSETQFQTIFRDGRRPDGSQMPEEMPWQNIGKTMSDDDLRAVQAYLKTLP